jgi:LPXTG-motif cell wall-anchored protein
VITYYWVVGEAHFGAIPESPDETPTISETSLQDPTATLPRTGDDSFGFLGIIAVLIVSSGSLFTAAYRSYRCSY